MLWDDLEGRGKDNNNNKTINVIQKGARDWNGRFSKADRLVFTGA